MIFMQNESVRENVSYENFCCRIFSKAKAIDLQKSHITLCFYLLLKCKYIQHPHFYVEVLVGVYRKQNGATEVCFVCQIGRHCK